jgi:hypothetical protein
MSASEATTIYIETTIPPGMTVSEYRSSRPRTPSLTTRLMSYVRGVTTPR